MDGWQKVFIEGEGTQTRAAGPERKRLCKAEGLRRLRFQSLLGGWEF